MSKLKSLVSLLNKLFFIKEEFLLSEYHIEDLSTILSTVCFKVNRDKEEQSSDLVDIGGVKCKFVGIVKSDFFCLSKKVSHPQSFLPRVIGRLESINEQTIIKLKYGLFPLTKFWLIFWLIICIGATTFITLHLSHKYPIWLPIVIYLGFYAVAYGNFKLHCRDFRKVLDKEI